MEFEEPASSGGGLSASGELSTGADASVRAGAHLFRLFVGWVPKQFTEADLKPLFDQWGDVRDIIVLKEKATGQPRGCAFVSYAMRDEAEAAIQHLDRRVQLPGALSPLEVRFARSHQYVQAGSGPEDNRQLFFARAPSSATEAEIRALFSRHGTVEEINLFRERRSHQSKGCGFVTMSARGEAVAAIEALDEKHLMAGASETLAVKWADPELQAKKRRAVEESNTEQRMVFFAKVLRSVGEDDVRALFSRYGRVFELNLFRAFQGAPTTKGCGLVTMGTADEAAAAIEGLDGKYTWDGMDGPMVVKWMDTELQKRRREEHLAAMRQGLVPSMGSPGPLASPQADPWSPTGAGAVAAAALAAAGGLAAGSAVSRGGRRSTSGGGGGEQGERRERGERGGGSKQLSAAWAQEPALPSDVPPPGCVPDAYKLFIGNVPKAYGEEDLLPLFESAGPVVELVVVRDKITHESKGSAFVWYRSRADADRAASLLNARHALRGGPGEPARPLVVRRANTRKAAGAALLSAPAGFASARRAPPGGAAAAGGGGQGQGPEPHLLMSSPTAFAAAAASAGGGASGGGYAGVYAADGAFAYIGSSGGGGGGGYIGGGGGGGYAPDGAPRLARLALVSQHELQARAQAAAAAQAQQAQQQPQYYLQQLPPPPPPQQQQQQQQPQPQPQQVVFHAVTSGGGYATAPGGFVSFVAAAPPTSPAHAQAQQQAQQAQAQQAQAQHIYVAAAVDGGYVYPQYGSASPGGPGSGSAPVSAATLSGGRAPPPGGAQGSSSLGQSTVAVLSGSGSQFTGPGNAGDLGGQMMQMQVPLMAGQMAAMTHHIYAIQTMTGADVTSQAVAPGVFHLVLRGTQPQLEAANQIIAAALQSL